MTVTIYHNPRCGTSRAALALIEAAGITPQVIEYLKTPPDRAALTALTHQLEGGARGLLRAKEAVFAELGLQDESLPEAALIEAMLAHPILMNRPVVVSPKGAKLCRPADLVLTLLPMAEGEGHGHS